MKILVIEDELKLAQVTERFLRHHGYTVTLVGSLQEAKTHLMDETFDAVLVDVRLPDGDGWSLVPSIKSNHPAPVVFMLTSRGEADDRVFGLELGADDYLVKPVVLKELIIRLERALKQRLPAGRQLGDVTIDEKARRVKSGPETISLAKMEFELLVYFFEHLGEALSRDQILDEVWGYTFGGDTRTVDTHVKQLRDKLPTIKQQLKTVHRVGYRLEAIE
ncbi:response regulator transcription factor [Exiguobacterium antarcticum]|uniref:Response regulator transcription factor n=1 Tax=Exiguobacterium antarcticum TaxID=132920 RepID=A0ABT6QY35_9BACL|nr:response regulator transcription factor [Exiguobacterium antarcticum]MDI3233603.1 response regulator transcription factor [Exiguobacterium antarcticum]